jgi:hypothetical protein
MEYAVVEAQSYRTCDSRDMCFPSHVRPGLATLGLERHDESQSDGIGMAGRFVVQEARLNSVGVSC